MPKSPSTKMQFPSPRDWPKMCPVPSIHYPESLNVCCQLLDSNVEAGRDSRIAVRHGEQSYSYGALMPMVEAFSASLVERGFRAGDRVVLRLNNNIEFVVAWLSVLRQGGIVVASMPLLRARELRQILEDCEPAFVLTQESLREEMQIALAGFPGICRILAGRAAGGWESYDDWVSNPARIRPASTRREDLALLAYTSGTTGQAKGTLHTHENVLAIADTYSRHILRPTPEDIFGGHPSLAFTFGLGGLLVFPFRVGASTVFIDRFTPLGMAEAVRDFGITITFCPPTSYKMMMRECGPELARYFGSLRAGVSAGETLPEAVWREWKERTGSVLLDGIGGTEMLHIFISNRLDDVRPGSTGTAVPGFEARLFDQEFREVGPGEQGRLAVRGPTGCRYWNRPERQREYVQRGWNFPGDIFWRDEQGYFHYCCRDDDMIICGGANISGPEVEAVLDQHPAVAECAVVASPDELKGFVPKAFIVLRPGHPPSEVLVRELQAYVKQEIAPYKYPRRVAFVEALPRTETGKLRRTELRAAELEAVSAGSAGRLGDLA